MSELVVLQAYDGPTLGAAGFTAGDVDEVLGPEDGPGPVLGTVVGGGSQFPRGSSTELTGIGVLPRARRSGIGAAVAAALVADARAHGVGTVFLVAQDDAVARAHERVGFVRGSKACIAEAAP